MNSLEVQFRFGKKCGKVLRFCYILKVGSQLSIVKQNHLKSDALQININNENIFNPNLCIKQ